MTYAESARRGEFLTTAQNAVLTGSLWAVGLSWSTAIRSVVIALIPDDTRDVVLGELLAAGITTFVAVGLSILVSARCCSSGDGDATPTSDARDARAPRRRGSSGVARRAMRTP